MSAQREPLRGWPCSGREGERGARRDVARTLCELWDGEGEGGNGRCRVFAAREGMRKA